jgi:cardiolipin synthase
MAESVMAAEERYCEGLRSENALDELSLLSRSASGRALALLRDDAFANLYRGSVSDYFSSGESFYEDMKKSLSSAQEFIFIETFIIEDGYMWQGIRKILLERIAAGVDVRVLYDDIGSMSSVPYDFDKRLRAEGIKCYRFGKVSPRLVSSHNNRDHRKICVIDGTIAYTGGINIADEYIGKKKRFGHWKDGGIKVRGEAARGFTKLFLMLYDMSLMQNSDYDTLLAPKKRDGCREEGGFIAPFGSGPSPIYPSSVGKNTLMNIIGFAESYLYISTPYLVIDYDLTEALCAAAKRGVDVRIITPGIADKKLVKIMTKSSYPYLIEAGVRIFEYTPGFIHEKAVVADSTLAMVGSINLDYRSLVHHFEDGVWIYGDPVIEKIRESLLDALALSREIEKGDARLTFSERAVRSVVKIFAPLL